MDLTVMCINVVSLANGNASNIHECQISKLDLSKNAAIYVCVGLHDETKTPAFPILIYLHASL
jgi:hypothetical protein